MDVVRETCFVKELLAYFGFAYEVLAKVEDESWYSGEVLAAIEFEHRYRRAYVHLASSFETLDEDSKYSILVHETLHAFDGGMLLLAEFAKAGVDEKLEFVIDRVAVEYAESNASRLAKMLAEAPAVYSLWNTTKGHQDES